MIGLAKWALHVTGADDTTGVWYGFWSGFAGNIPLFGGLFLLFRRHVCHQQHCYRIGKHPIDGTPYVVCHKHHPDLGGK